MTIDVIEILEVWQDDENLEWFLIKSDGQREYLTYWNHDEDGYTGRDSIEHCLKKLCKIMNWKYSMEEVLVEEA